MNLVHVNSAQTVSLWVGRFGFLFFGWVGTIEKSVALPRGGFPRVGQGDVGIVTQTDSPQSTMAAAIMANRILSPYLGDGSGVRWSTIGTSRIRRGAFEGRVRSRDRVLSRAELRKVWAALLETEAKNPDGDTETTP